MQVIWIGLPSLSREGGGRGVVDVGRHGRYIVLHAVLQVVYHQLKGFLYVVLFPCKEIEDQHVPLVAIVRGGQVDGPQRSRQVRVVRQKSLP